VYPWRAVVDSFEASERIEVVLLVELEMLRMAVPYQFLEIGFGGVADVGTELERMG